MKSGTTYRVLRTSLCVICLCADTMAQNEKDTTKSINVDEVLVTATRTMVNRNNVPLTLTVISRENIENSSESALLPVISEQVPGLFVTERGITGFGVSTGAAGQINLRGIGGSPNTQVLVLLNGNPQFMGIMGHPLPDAYVASDVQKVEVIRGPASTLYGTNAMGGVINIITKEQKEDGFNTNIRLMYGSYNTQKYMVNGGFKKKGFNVFASFNRDQTAGHRDSSDFSINNGYVKIGYATKKHLNVNADFSLANFKATDPGPEDSKAGHTIDITRGMGAIALDNKFDKTNGSLRVFYNFGDHKISDGFHSTDKNHGIILYQTLKLFKGNTITLGTDYKKYGGIAENLKAMNGNGIVFGDTIVREMAGYVYFQQNLFEKLTLNAGFRLEHNSVYGDEPVPTAGLAFRTSSTTIIKASIAKGFRSPTIRELYLWGTANAGLKAEKMVNYEVGILKTLMDNRLSVELTGFKAHGNNVITAVAGSNGMKFENSGSFSNVGIEFSGTFKPYDNLTLNANYSLISMKKALLGTPEQQLFISGTYKWNKWVINMSAKHIHNLTINLDANQQPHEIYTLINARIAFIANRYINLFLKGENFFNTKYYINYGYPMPGFVAFGGINIHFFNIKTKTEI